jgi:DNA-binding beta-propeller fold protein YncE
MRALTALLLVGLTAGCSSLSDREMLFHAGVFSVMQIPLASQESEPIGADKVMVDPGTHVVYVAGDQSDRLAVVDGLAAHLVRHAELRPEGEAGGPPEGLIATPYGGAIFVRLPDFDGVPVMVHIGGEPNHVLAADAVASPSDPGDPLPRRLMIASDEAGFVLLADKGERGGIDFQCLVTDNDPFLICPDSIPGEFPVDMAWSPHQRRVYLLSATDGSSSRLRAYGTAGELWSVQFPGGPVEGRILIDEADDAIHVIQQSLATVHRFDIDGGEPQALMAESGPIEVVQDRETGWLYVACRDAHSVVAIDPISGERESLRLEASPSAMVIDPDAGYLFVGLREGRDMAVIDLRTHLVSSVDVFGPQRHLAVDPDYRLVYAVLEGESLSRMVY